jgi:Flp pilus assembly protein TadD
MQNRAEYAMGQFLRVLKLDPKHYKAWDNLGLCYDAAGNPDQAIRSFLTSIKLVEKDHPDYDWPYANLSDLLLRQNRYQEAYDAAFEAANRNPRSARNFYLAGQALVKLERQDDARKWLEQAVTLDASYPDALYALGQMYVRTGEKEKAAETLKRFREVKANAPKKKR